MAHSGVAGMKGMSKIPSLPDTGNGVTGRMLPRTHATAPSKASHIAADSSADDIGRQSSNRTMQSAWPDPCMAGAADAQIRRSPRYGVRHVRTSIVLRPDAIADAYGWRTDNAFMGGHATSMRFGLSSTIRGGE